MGNKGKKNDKGKGKKNDKNVQKKRRRTISNSSSDDSNGRYL